MDLLEVMKKRYAAKEFKSEKIREKDLQSLLDIIRYSPSGLNLQPWRIKVIGDQKLKEELAKFSFTPTQVLTCSHLLVFCANTNLDEVIEKASNAMKRVNYPKERLDGMLEITKAIRDKLDTSWAKEQVYISLGVAVVAAGALGLDACPMTGFDPSGYARILGLPKHIVPVVLLAIGYASDMPVPKARLSLEEILI